MSIALVKLTTYISILVQFITGIFGVIGITYKLPQPHTILTDALKIEMFVQLIEFLFYIGLVFWFHVGSMAKKRYYDWFITTPTMLFTTVLVYNYIRIVEEEKKENVEITLKQFVLDYAKPLTIIVISNFMMLVFGYLGEIGMIPIEIATLIGFIFLGITFMIIYNYFGKYLVNNKKLFVLLIGIWSMYGLIYLFPVIYKNIAYNFIDIVAKNFFGIYLYYKIRQVSKEKMKT